MERSWICIAVFFKRIVKPPYKVLYVYINPQHLFHLRFIFPSSIRLIIVQPPLLPRLLRDGIRTAVTHFVSPTPSPLLTSFLSRPSNIPDVAQDITSLYSSSFPERTRPSRGCARPNPRAPGLTSMSRAGFAPGPRRTLPGQKSRWGGLGKSDGSVEVGLG